MLLAFTCTGMKICVRMPLIASCLTIPCTNNALLMLLPPNCAGMDICVRKPLIASCSTDKSVRLWNYNDRTCELVKWFPDEIFSIAIHPSGLQVCVWAARRMQVHCVWAASHMQAWAARHMQVCVWAASHMQAWAARHMQLHLFGGSRAVLARCVHKHVQSSNYVQRLTQALRRWQLSVPTLTVICNSIHVRAPHTMTYNECIQMYMYMNVQCACTTCACTTHNDVHSCTCMLAPPYTIFTFNCACASNTHVQVLVGFADKLRLMTVLMEDLKAVREFGIKVRGVQMCGTAGGAAEVV